MFLAILSVAVADLAHPRLAGIGDRGHRHPGDARAHPGRLLLLRIHAEPGHLVCAIFSIGILVDDAIVVVENIVRHYRLPENRNRPVLEVAVEAVDEVGNPTILATFTVIAAILPMAFVRGLMGPYMRPIPVGASAAMVFSLIVAFIVTPWASFRLLKRQRNQGDSEEIDPHAQEGWSTRMYRQVMGRLINVPTWRYGFLAMVVVLLLGALGLFAVKAVIVKMLPFDNKSEFQVIIDMPEGTTLEQTAAVTLDIGDFLKTVPEVTDYQMYVGASAPYNFNGLVRHYFLRSASNQADIQVNLAPKEDAARQSHEIAKRVRPADPADRAQICGARESGRSSARPAGPANARRRSLRPGLRASDADRPADREDPDGDRRRS